MKNNKQLIAKVLEVETVEAGVGGDPDRRPKSSFKALKFENGLILVPGETTHDWFFENTDLIEACGLDIVTSVEETGETEIWTAQELLRSVQGSIREFGINAVPQKHLELWK